MTGLDDEFDFVVVGSGGGSMCSALVMRDASRSVVILEKTGLIGGTTARSGGILWIPNSRFMKEHGIPDSREAATAYLEATSGQSVNAPGTTAGKPLAYIDHAPKMIDFLVSKGVRLRRPLSWPDYHDELPGGSVPGRTVGAELFDTRALGAWQSKLRPAFLPLPATPDELQCLWAFKPSWKARAAMLRVALRVMRARLTGANVVSFGAALQGRMLLACLENGVDLRVDSGVTGFLVEDGAVKGVITRRNGRDWRIGVRLGVLVNAGGFSQNREMRARYQPDLRVDWTGATEGDTGEMLQAMMKLGAATGQMDAIVGQQMMIGPVCENRGNGVNLMQVGGQKDIAKPHSILVDRTGARYLNEGGSYVLFCQLMRQRNCQVPATPSWQVVDSRYMEKYMYCGTMPGTAKPREWLDSGFLLKKTDTIEALAGQMEVDPAVLRATVDTFNEGVCQGRDPLFHRGNRAYDNWLGDFTRQGSQALGPIEKGPFYATPVVPGDLGTLGGVVTDVHARVLREDGSPVPGLYATGVSTASMIGRCYPGAGASVGPSFLGGYLAARHAAGIGL